MSNTNDCKQDSRLSNEHAKAEARAGAPLGSEKTRGANEPLNQHPLNHESSIGEADALRLEKRTKPNTGKYRITLTNYGNGLGEIGWSFIHTYQPNKAPAGKSLNRELNIERSVRRARSRMRKVILATNANHLLTLTYRKNMMDFDQSYADLTKFIRLVRKDIPNWIYIAVAEKQKRGAWHWHLAVSGRQDVNLLRRAWLKAVRDGNIDINAPKTIARHRQLALVSYLSKYMAKTFDSEENGLYARKYRVSRGIHIPSETITLPENEVNATQYVLDTLQQKIGSVGHVWIAGDLAAGWACSWK